MKSVRWVALAILALCAASVFPQVQLSAPQTFSWPAASATGQVGQYLDLAMFSTPPTNISIDWSNSGTAPSACTFRVEGSSDAVTWFGLDATSPAADSVPCTSSNAVSIVQRPFRFIRVNLVTYTQGDGTTKVIFHFTGNGASIR